VGTISARAGLARNTNALVMSAIFKRFARSLFIAFIAFPPIEAAGSMARICHQHLSLGQASLDLVYPGFVAVQRQQVAAGTA